MLYFNLNYIFFQTIFNVFFFFYLKNNLLKCRRVPHSSHQQPSTDLTSENATSVIMVGTGGNLSALFTCNIYYISLNNFLYVGSVGKESRRNNSREKYPKQKIPDEIDFQNL